MMMTRMKIERRMKMEKLPLSSYENLPDVQIHVGVVLLVLVVSVRVVCGVFVVFVVGLAVHFLRCMMQGKQSNEANLTAKEKEKETESESQRPKLKGKREKKQ